MKILMLLSFFAFFALALADGKDCGCRRAAADETTRWGGNQTIVVTEEETYKFLAGKVADPNGEAIEGALVEVFDKPDYLLCGILPNNPNGCMREPPADQRRIAACITGENGSFCFPKLKAGTYEVRVSMSIVFNPTHVVVTVDPKDKDAKKGDMETQLTLGT